MKVKALHPDCHIISSGGHGSQLLHIKNLQPLRSHEQRLVGKYRPDGEGQSEDPRDSVQHAQAGCGKSGDSTENEILKLYILSKCHVKSLEMIEMLQDKQRHCI